MLVSNNQGLRMQESRRRPYTSGLGWSLGLERDEFPSMDLTIPFKCIPSWFDYDVPRIAVY